MRGRCDEGYLLAALPLQSNESFHCYFHFYSLRISNASTSTLAINASATASLITPPLVVRRFRMIMSGQKITRMAQSASQKQIVDTKLTSLVI
jgi:hypothetical protein